MQDGLQQSNGKAETSHHPEMDPKREDKNYYGVPPIKHAHWTWQIPVYFWIGGLGAGGHLFSPLAHILGHKHEALAPPGRYPVVGPLILSPTLFVWAPSRPLVPHDRPDQR